MLIPYTCNLIKQIQNKYPDTIIIAGGGVRNWDTANVYLNLGADHLSISTLFFHPFKFINFYSKYLINSIL